MEWIPKCGMSTVEITAKTCVDGVDDDRLYGKYLMKTKIVAIWAVE